ncbi:MAG: N-acetylglucosamine kinase [Bacteroidetes bacterium]|nr:N-acetylglucosamine kinase [Bacteroidota bacterium]
MPIQLIADSGSTKCDWVMLEGKKRKKITTGGLNPYFLERPALRNILANELVGDFIKKPEEIFFYGTALGQSKNLQAIKALLKETFPKAKIEVETDITGAARAVCGNEKGLAAILGTGSSLCVYNGKKIVKSSPGLGFILGDEGSGAYLGKKVIQLFLYGAFDEELNSNFCRQFQTDKATILNHVYAGPLPNKYLASFALFLASNRGHYMIENIIEDSFRKFFELHITRFKESEKYPLGFIGSIAFGFKDVLETLCREYGFIKGKIMQSPLDGLIKFHSYKN